MRLTLRTLLAFLDGILEPEDQADIGEKVKESEFATQLVHRTRDVVRRMRLEAPQLVDTGVCRDPNSVAEYLDNTLAPEQIQEFEKACLESDVHLAEVGSCHHILTMILGEPATVDPASRERMYRLGSENAELAAAARPVPISEADATDAHLRGKPEVPDYLRKAGDAGGRSLAVVGLIAAAVVGIMLLFFPDMFGSSNPDPPGDVATVTPTTPEPTTPEPTGPAVETPAPVAPVAGTHITSPEPAATAPTIDTPTTDTPTGPAAPTGDVHPEPIPPAAEDSVEEAADAETPSEATAPATTLPEATAEPVVDEIAPEPEVVAPETATTETTDPETADPGAVPPVETTPAATAPVEESVAEEPAPRRNTTVGKLLSENQVLLRWNPNPEDDTADVPPSPRWERLGRQASLRVGDKLLVLPSNRPMIIVGGTTIEIDNGSLIELTDLDVDNVPQITLHYGRMVVLSLGNPDARLKLVLNQHHGIATLRDAESTLAVELRPYRQPGSNPADVASYAAIDLYSASGEVLWEEEGEELALASPLHLALSIHPTGPAIRDDEIPAWVENPQLTPLDRRAAPQVAQRIRQNKTVKLSLAELADHRLPEVRNLAIRSCAHVGHYDPLIRALSDERFRTGWSTFTRELRDALDRDPEKGEKILLALERTYADEAARIYRMLWGFNNEQLLKGEAKSLVQDLDAEDLIVRVVSFWNLEDIKGVRYNYRPEYSESRRRQAVGRWRKEEKSDSIVHPEPEPKRAAPQPVLPTGEDVVDEDALDDPNAE